MTATRDLLTTVAQMIAAAGVGSWSTTGVPSPNLPAVVLKKMPASPDRAIVLNLVSQGDDVSMPLGRVMIQVRSRGAKNDPLDASDLDDAVFNLLHGISHLAVGSAEIIQLRRQVNTTLGFDDLNREEVVSQFYGDIAAAPTVLRPEGGSW